MGIVERWRKGPRPDPAVLELLNHLQQAAERGEIRALAVVTVDPLLKIESSSVGDLEETGVRKHVLAAGLIEIGHKLLTK